MATTYTYTDTFILNGVEDIEIETAEIKALKDLEKQGVTDVFYLEEMCKCLVYIDLSIKQQEAEEMDSRTKRYKEEYDRYSKMNTNTDKTVGSFEIGRA